MDFIGTIEYNIKGNNCSMGGGGSGMNQTLCFVINHVEIYLEQVLVENDGVPILFVGKNNERRYLILCVDMDVLRYFAVRISRKDLSDLLQGTVPMRDIFLRQAVFWDIAAGDDMKDDAIVGHCISNIDADMLPREGAVFEVLTENVAQYVRKIKNN